MPRHILVVDDDGDVRETITSMLSANGFAATAASDGVAMREFLANDRVWFDVIVLDALMPGEPSTSLADHAKEKEIPVVMISGDIHRMTFARNNGLQLLRKPFRTAELIRAIEEAIASGQHGQREC